MHSSLLGHHTQRVIMLRQASVTPAPSEGNGQPVLTEEELQRQAELEKDLQLARDIQQGMLLAAVPYLPGWEFSAVSIPARDLGGDLYDFLPLGNGRQAIMIGDVSGKGLQAALRMAVARTVFRHEARLDGAPGPTLAAINRGVCTDIPQGMITMLYAVLDPINGELRVANAGHTYPLLFNESVQEFEMPGLPLGVDPDDDYDEESIPISPGDSMFLFTDGVNEAISPEDEEFGYDRLHALLANNSHMKPRALLKLFLHELRAWSVGRMQTDDITMVILRRRFTLLSDELRVVALDVLGSEQTELFFERIAESFPRPPEEMTHDDWASILPIINKVAKSSFSRGIARELSQQIRLTIEEYRPASGG